MRLSFQNIIFHYVRRFFFICSICFTAEHFEIITLTFSRAKIHLIIYNVVAVMFGAIIKKMRCGSCFGK